MDDIYREEILEHYRHPQNYGKIEKPDITKGDSNPLCGDMQEITIKLDGDTIKNVSFTGKGCAISIASASILTEHIKGKTLGEVQNMTREDLLDLVKLELTPTRIKCAMLPLTTIKKGIIEYESKKKITDSIATAITQAKKKIIPAHTTKAKTKPKTQKKRKLNKNPKVKKNRK